MSIAVYVGEISEAGSPYGTGYRVVWFLLRSERKNSLFFSCNFHDLISEQIHSLVSKDYNTIYGIQKNTFLTPKQLSCPTTMANYMSLNILHLQETYILCIFCDLHIGVFCILQEFNRYRQHSSFHYNSKQRNQTALTAPNSPLG